MDMYANAIRCNGIAGFVSLRSTLSEIWNAYEECFVVERDLTQWWCTTWPWQPVGSQLWSLSKALCWHCNCDRRGHRLVRFCYYCELTRVMHKMAEHEQMHSMGGDIYLLIISRSIRYFNRCTVLIPVLQNFWSTRFWEWSKCWPSTGIATFFVSFDIWFARSGQLEMQPEIERANDISVLMPSPQTQQIVFWSMRRPSS